MPLIEKSSFRPRKWMTNGHVQTIYPSYFRKEAPVDYTREKIPTPDKDYLYLDWSLAGQERSRELLVLSHGLCGNTSRHYILSMVRTFNQAGIDCVAWNYRGCGKCDNGTVHITTNNSTDELGWVVNHALKCGHYQKIYLLGFSMGGNITALYLGREKDIPPEVKAGIAFCGTVELVSCAENLSHFPEIFYSRYFLRQLKDIVVRKHEQFPDQVSLYGLEDIHTMRAFDNRYTAPMNGFRNALDYWHKASALPWLEKLDRPFLLVNPSNDPFLGKNCYPVELARKSPWLYLEIPSSGGHCGFMTEKNRMWWPAERALAFIQQIQRPDAPEKTGTVL